MLFTTPQENNISDRIDLENQSLSAVENGDVDSHAASLKLTETRVRKVFN